MVFGKKQLPQEEIFSFGIIDAATCEQAKGIKDETGRCISIAMQDPDDPDLIHLKRPKYRKPSEGISPPQ